MFTAYILHIHSILLFQSDFTFLSHSIAISKTKMIEPVLSSYYYHWHNSCIISIINNWIEQPLQQLQFKIFAYVLVDISKLMPLFFFKCIWYLILIIYFLTNKCLRQIDFILFNRVYVTKTSSIYNHISYSIAWKMAKFSSNPNRKDFCHSL